MPVARSHRLPAALAAALLVVGLVAGATHGSEDPRPVAVRRPMPTAAAAPAPRPPPPTATTTTTVPPPTTESAPQPDPATLRPPTPAADPGGLAQQIVTAETIIRDPAATPADLAEMALLQQVAYRRFAHHPEWDAPVFAAVPAELHGAVLTNLVARREFVAMQGRVADTLPAWRIVEPAPPAELLAHYREAGAAFGIHWPYLAAINLVETGMGRIRGLSSAGAQGPMQFIPSTWAAFGRGDINDPRDAIFAAARYLAHNNGANDIAHALFRYNNSSHYVRGVMKYAEVMAADERAFYGYHQWGIFLVTVAGDVYLPVGYQATMPIPVADYLARR